MDRVKSVLNSIKLVVVSTLETIFAIGTSVVAAGVLFFVSSGVTPDDLFLMVIKNHIKKEFEGVKG